MPMIRNLSDSQQSTIAARECVVQEAQRVYESALNWAADAHGALKVGERGILSDGRLCIVESRNVRRMHLYGRGAEAVELDVEYIVRVIRKDGTPAQRTLKVWSFDSLGRAPEAAQ